MLCLCNTTLTERWQFNHKTGHFKSSPSYLPSCGIPAQWATLFEAKEAQMGIMPEADS